MKKLYLLLIPIACLISKETKMSPPLQPQFPPKSCFRGSFTNPLKKGYISLEGEALYWKPYGYIPYVVREEMSINGIPTNIKDPQVNLKAHVGFRLQLGYYIPRPTWYTTAQYTQMIAKGTDNLTNNGKRADGLNSGTPPNFEPFSWLWPLATPVVGFNEAATASAFEEVSLKTLDWAIAKSFITFSNFTFDPYFGFRYARVKVGMDLFYSARASQGALSGQEGTAQVNLKNNFNSLGLRGGFKANWKLGKGFEIFGDTSFSSLLGTFYLMNRTQVDQIISDTRQQSTLTDTEKYKDIYQSFQFALGLIWGKVFKDNVYFGMKLGYEMNVWPSFLRIMKNPPQSTSINPQILPFVNNLSFQGLTGSLKLDF